MNRHKNNNMLPREFNGNSPGEIISDPYTIANKFNDYFVNVGPGIARNIPNSKRTFNEYLFIKGSFTVRNISGYSWSNIYKIIVELICYCIWIAYYFPRAISIKFSW